MDGKCSDRFCYICDNVVPPNPQGKIPDFVKKTYQISESKDGIRISHSLLVCCKICTEKLRDWRNGKRKIKALDIPLISREGKDYIIECDIFLIFLKRINQKNIHHVQYSYIPSVISPHLHVPDLPFSEPDATMKYSSKYTDITVVGGVTHKSQRRTTSQYPRHNRKSTQRLGSRLKEWYLLAPRAMLYRYRDRERELRQFITFLEKSSLIYCKNIAGLIKSMDLEYDITE